jgi:hypothetical protein
MIKTATQKRPHWNPPNPPNKKQRVLPIPWDHQSNKSANRTDNGNTTPTTSTSPPPSALSFLAKLNKENNYRDTSMSSKEKRRMEAVKMKKNLPGWCQISTHMRAEILPEARGSHPNQK